MSSVDVWTFREESVMDVTGFKVEAVDGSIGKIDEATYEVGSSQLVVDTGPWIFGKKVVLPAGIVDRIDRDDETVYVNRTKDQIKNSPKFGDVYSDDASRADASSYSVRGGRLPRPGDQRPGRVVQARPALPIHLETDRVIAAPFREYTP